MSIQVYPEGKLKFYTGVGSGKVSPFSTVITGGAAVKMLLIKQGGQFDPNNTTITAVIAGGVEMSGGSYARKTLANITNTKSGSAVYMTSDPVVFSALPIGNTVVAAVLYVLDPNIGTDATATPIAWYDGGSYPFEVPKATTGGDFTCNPHPIEGWVKS